MTRNPKHENPAIAELRAQADRFDLRDEPVMATLCRNAAWEIEQGYSWLDAMRIERAS